MFFRYVTKHACDRQTDKQTDGQNYDPQDRASIAASRSKTEQFHDVCYNTAYDAFVTFFSMPVQPYSPVNTGDLATPSMRTK